jgi:23S rRNA pseudouridine955/2504/2580 synthase
MPSPASRVEILQENDEIWVVLKPSGLAVQPGERVSLCLVDLLEERFGRRPFLVHRLDKETEGLILVAKSSRAAAKYSRLIESGASRKRYLAVCAGAFSSSSGSIDEDIRTARGERCAKTLYAEVRRYGEFSLVRLEILTGRTHQIRIHLAGLGHPVLGDDRHGDFALNKRAAKDFGVKKLMLFAESIRIDAEPRLEASAPLPPHFADFFSKFKGD